MRRQYHSRLSGNGKLVWDIHRLIELSRKLPVIRVQTDTILEQEHLYWFDACRPATTMDFALHAGLIQAADLGYPIILCAEGRLMDGMHRVCKAFLQNQSVLAAVKFEYTPEPDYIDVDVSELPYDEPW